MKKENEIDIEDIELPEKKNKKKKRKRKKTIKVLIFIIVEILLLALLIPLLFGKLKLDKIKKFGLDNEKLNITDLELDDYYNIAVFGIDARDDELEKNTRSDSMILVSINTKTKEIKLTSFYRDTCVYVEGHGYTKLCHAYSYGGPELAIATLNDNFDLNIEDFITVNFTAVAESIDLLDGVEIDVKEKEIKSINKYGKEVADIYGKDFKKVESAGLQTLDGCQAVGYSRIRKIDSDFVRTSRQRTVIDAMFKKVKNTDFSTINDIFDEISSKMLTSMSNEELLAIMKDALSYEITESDGFPYKNKTGYIKKKSYVIPDDLTNNVIQLHEKLFGTIDYQPTDDVKEYSEYLKD